MARAKRTRVNVQDGPDTGKGPLSRTIPSLQRLCGDRYPEPLRYGQPLPDTRVRSLGRFVRLGKGREALGGIIRGSTAPPRPTLAQLQRGAASLCDRGYLLETPGGVLVSVNASQVREQMRAPREPLCEYHQGLDALSLGAVVEEVGRRARGGLVAHPRDELTDMPFPHRRGSSPCCEASDVSPETVLRLLEEWERGECCDNMTGRDFVALVGRAVPKSSGISKPRTLAGVRKALAAVREHCWRLWQERAAKVLEPRREKFKRVKADVRAKYAPPKKRAA